jgi:hypothetical protein
LDTTNFVDFFENNKMGIGLAKRAERANTA